MVVKRKWPTFQGGLKMGSRFLYVAVFLGVSCLGMQAFAQSANRPETHVGDRWSWQHTNGLANEGDFTRIEDVVEVSEKEIRTRVRTKGQSGSAIAAYTRDWNPVD